MASIEYLPGCCTGATLVGLGEDGHGGREVLTIQQLQELLDKRLKTPRGARYSGTQIMIATTNGHSQPRTEAILAEAGFECNEERSSVSRAKAWIMTNARWMRLNEERFKAMDAAEAAAEAERIRQREAAAQQAREQAEREAAERRERQRLADEERARQQELPVEGANRQGPFRDAQGRFAARPAQPQHNLQNGDRFRLPGEQWAGPSHTQTPVHRYRDGVDVGPWPNRFGRLQPHQVRQSPNHIRTEREWLELPVVDLPRYPR